MFDVVMPKMGESITEGTILEWKKKVGDTINKDETLLEISTDKVDSEIPSPATGTVVEIIAQVNDTIPVGDVIARIGGADEKVDTPPEKKEEVEVIRESKSFYFRVSREEKNFPKFEAFFWDTVISLLPYLSSYLPPPPRTQKKSFRRVYEV